MIQVRQLPAFGSIPPAGGAAYAVEPATITPTQTNARKSTLRAVMVSSSVATEVTPDR
jgi:hypothetical protein